MDNWVIEIFSTVFFCWLDQRGEEGFAPRSWISNSEGGRVMQPVCGFKSASWGSCPLLPLKCQFQWENFRIPFVSPAEKYSLRKLDLVFLFFSVCQQNNWSECCGLAGLCCRGSWLGAWWVRLCDRVSSSSCMSRLVSLCACLCSSWLLEAAPRLLAANWTK